MMSDLPTFIQLAGLILVVCGVLYPLVGSVGWACSKIKCTTCTSVYGRVFIIVIRPNK